jgi:hypothetical protein
MHPMHLLEHCLPLLPILVVCWWAWEARRYRRRAVSPPPSALPLRSAGRPAPFDDELQLEPWPHEELRHMDRRRALS